MCVVANKFKWIAKSSGLCDVQDSLLLLPVVFVIIQYIIGMTYGYIRGSTDKQTVENQRYEILRFCGAQGLSVDAWIEETISGTVEVGRRGRGSILDGAELAVSVMLLAGTSMSQMTRALGTHHRTLSRFIERRRLDSTENLSRVREMLGQAPIRAVSR